MCAEGFKDLLLDLGDQRSKLLLDSGRRCGVRTLVILNPLTKLKPLRLTPQPTKAGKTIIKTQREMTRPRIPDGPLNPRPQSA